MTFFYAYHEHFPEVHVLCIYLEHNRPTCYFSRTCRSKLMKLIMLHSYQNSKCYAWSTFESLEIFQMPGFVASIVVAMSCGPILMTQTLIAPSLFFLCQHIQYNPSNPPLLAGWNVVENVQLKFYNYGAAHRLGCKHLM